MTDQEYEEISKRVNKYYDLENHRNRLNEERSMIANGVSRIMTFYSREIDCAGRYGKFQDGIRDTLLEFYDNEIEKIEKQMEEI